MSDDLLRLAADLQARGEPFALATVVRCERPTSAKPGAKALVRADGTVTGWVGGACAEPVVVREARAALQDGRPRLVGLVGDASRAGARRGAGGPGAPGAATPSDAPRSEGVVTHPMTCHSGGTLEIYVEPYLPRPLLVLVGHGPILEALAALGREAGHAVVALGAGAPAPDLEGLGITARGSVVVATHADADAGALERALATGAGYVSLVASRRRAAAIVETLRRRGIPAERLERLRSPAGLDIGAVTPAEIAVSILAEIIRDRRRQAAAPAQPPPDPAEPYPARPESKPAPAASLPSGGRLHPASSGARPAAAGSIASSAPAEAVDPICGMLVEIASARHRSHAAGQLVVFCCASCKETFDADPGRHLAARSG